MTKPIRFRASVVKGSGRGKSLKVPTLNLDLTSVPPDLEPGVYACRAILPGVGVLPATMHMGPRPTFADTPSCEIHVIDAVIDQPPVEVDVEVIEFIREIEKFPSAEALMDTMQNDIRKAREVLNTES